MSLGEGCSPMVPSWFLPAGGEYVGEKGAA
jgi:hypothetical protein